MGDFAVLGDDLTGAMDTGIQLVRKGFKVCVAVHGDFIDDLRSCSDVVVVDTETRNIPPETASSIVAESVRKMKNAGLRLIYKKIDSTLRGNIGKELEAAVHAGGFNMALLVPALPQNGRTTREGYHFLNGLKLTESDLSKDPFSPVKSAYIPEIVGYQTAIPAGTVTIDEVRRGADQIAEKLSALYSQGVGIAIADAESTGDMKMLAEAVAKCHVRLLPCGSAGLFSELYQYMEKSCIVDSILPPGKKGPVMVISGSPAKVNKMQLQLAERSGEDVIRLDCGKAGKDGTDWKTEVERVRASALKSLKSGRNVIIDGAGEGKNEIYSAFKDKPEMLVMSGNTIQTALADIFACVIEEACISGVMMIGGDTAANICRRMNVKGLKLREEVESFVPSGWMIGGKVHGMPVVTKAGGFGTEDVILKAINYLQGEKENAR